MSDFDPKDIQADISSDFDLEDVYSPSEPSFQQMAPEAISASEAALKGAQQGLTMGFSDEAAGGIQALLDKLNRAGNKIGILPESPTQVSERLAAEGFVGDIGPQDSSELYREARDIERAKIAAAGEEQPLAFTAGGVAGGMAIPGLGQLGAVSKGAGAAEKILAASKLGGTLGAGMGLGTSEAEDLSGMAKDTLTGGLVGAGTASLLTGALAAGGAAAKPVKELAKNVSESSKLKELSDIFKSASKGESVSGKRADLTKQIQSEGIELFQTLKNKAQSLEQAKQDMLSSAPVDKKIDLSNLITQYRSKLVDLKSVDPEVRGFKQGLLDLTDDISNNQDIKNLSAKQAYELKQLLQTASGEIKNPQLQKITNSTSKAVQDSIDEVIPGLKTLNKEQSNLMSQSEAMFGIKPLEQISDADLPGFMKKTGTTLEKLAKDSAAQDAISKEAALAGFKNLKGQEVPGIEKLVPEATPVLEKAKQTAQKIDLSKKIEQSSEGYLPSTYQLADVAGKIAKPFVNSAKSFSNDIPELMQKTSDGLKAATPERLMAVADDMVAKMGDKAAVEASILRKASSRQGVGRDALIFSLMQRPGFREYINQNKEEVESGE